MHKHHIMPRHLGGTNHPDNLVKVSVTEHAEIHRCLWIYSGRWQDEIAWKVLSGQIGKDEARRLACSLSRKGTKHSSETKLKMSLAKKGKKQSLEHRARKVASREGYRHSEETRQKMSLSHKGKPQRPCSEKTKNKLSLSHKGLNTWSKGRPRSAETKEKIRQASLKQWKRQKGV